MSKALRGPVFILGFPRSGTTGLASGLTRIAGFPAFTTEGHFIYLLDNLVTRIASDQLNPNCVVRNPGAKAAFLSGLAENVDRAFRYGKDTPPFHWVDKTPDIAQVQAIPTILKLFPTARFIYMYRDPLTCVRSNIATWPGVLEGKAIEVGNRWLACARQWRAQREKIAPENRTEIDQKMLRDDPTAAVQRLSRAIPLSNSDQTILLDYWTNNRKVNRPSSGEHAQVYDKVMLTDDEITKIAATCNEEVAIWQALLSERNSQ